jgi:hypothetical protein
MTRLLVNGCKSASPLGTWLTISLLRVVDQEGHLVAEAVVLAGFWQLAVHYLQARRIPLQSVLVVLE